MSSITKLPNGRRAIHYYANDGVRRTLRVGKVSLKDAERVRQHLDELLAAQFVARAPHADTSAWLATVPDKLHKRLEKAGLAKTRRATATALATALDAMIATRVDWKPTQRRAMTTAKRHLVAFYGADRDVKSISLADANGYRHHLVARKYAPPTVSKQIKCARSFFRYMVDASLIHENPFTRVKTGSQDNPARSFFVEADVADRLLAVCPNDEWRVIIALARFAGLRMPSEMLPLKWSDIRWGEERFRVHSPKTAGKGKGERWSPLWPKVRVELERLAAGGVDPEQYVIQIHRFSATALREGIMLRLKAAGVPAWAKVWQNMRSSCATSLIEEGHAAELVARWIGNTPAVLQKHYIQTRDRQYIVAVQQSASYSASVSVGQGQSLAESTRVSEAAMANDPRRMPLTGGAVGPEGPIYPQRLAGFLESRLKTASVSASRRDAGRSHPAPLNTSFRKIARLAGKGRA